MREVLHETRNRRLRGTKGEPGAAEQGGQRRIGRMGETDRRSMRRACARAATSSWIALKSPSTNSDASMTISSSSRAKASQNDCQRGVMVCSETRSPKDTEMDMRADLVNCYDAASHNPG
jgi:hypothetical protein